MLYSLTLHAFEVNAGEDHYTLQLSHPHSPSTSTNWQVGDEWIVDIEVYDIGDRELMNQLLMPEATIWGSSGVAYPTAFKYDSTKMDYYYSLLIRIEDIEVYQKTPCWKMIISPFLNDLSSKGERSNTKYGANEILDQHYEVWVNKTDYSLVRIVYTGNKERINPSIRHYPKRMPILFVDNSLHIPYNIIPFAMNSNLPNVQIESIYDQNNKVNLNKETNDTTSIISLFYHRKTRDANLNWIMKTTWITQSWKVGAKWWSTYEKRSKDRVFMRAKLREERE